MIFGDWVYNNLVCNNGNSRLVGGLGNDRLIGEAGRDRLEGGAGTDYSGETTEITVRLLAKAGWRTAFGDTFFSIEGIYGGSAGDTIKGDKVGNRVYGNDGGYTLVGHLGSVVPRRRC